MLLPSQLLRLLEGCLSSLKHPLTTVRITQTQMSHERTRLPLHDLPVLSDGVVILARTVTHMPFQQVEQQREWIQHQPGLDTSGCGIEIATVRGFRSSRPGETYRELLIQLYGQQIGSQVKQAEAFQVSEYGSQPSLEELKKLFPFFD
jgi:hypothetical protein